MSSHLDCERIAGQATYLDCRLAGCPRCATSVIRAFTATAMALETGRTLSHTLADGTAIQLHMTLAPLRRTAGNPGAAGQWIMMVDHVGRRFDDLSAAIWRLLELQDAGQS